MRMERQQEQVEKPGDDGRHAVDGGFAAEFADVAEHAGILSKRQHCCGYGLDRGPR